MEELMEKAEEETVIIKAFIDKYFIEDLSDEEFNKYAFSYKGRKIVLDNIDFI